MRIDLVAGLGAMAGWGLSDTLWVVVAIFCWGFANAHYGPLSEAYGWFPMNWWAWMTNSIIVLLAVLLIRRAFMYPLVAVALAAVFLRERLSPPQLAGGALAMLGLVGMAL